MADRGNVKRDDQGEDMSPRSGADEQIRGIANEADEEDFEDAEDLDEEDEDEEGTI